MAWSIFLHGESIFEKLRLRVKLPPQKKSFAVVESWTRIAGLVGGRSPDWASRPRLDSMLHASKKQENQIELLIKQETPSSACQCYPSLSVTQKNVLHTHNNHQNILCRLCNWALTRLVNLFLRVWPRHNESSFQFFCPRSSLPFSLG